MQTPSTPDTAFADSDLPAPVEIFITALYVVLVPLAILGGWIALYALVHVIFGAATAPFSIVMIALSAIYFGALSMWGAGGH